MISLNPGQLIQLNSGVECALPVTPCYVLADSPLQISPNQGGTYAALTNSNVEPGAFVQGGFIKSGSQANVVAKKVNPFLFVKQFNSPYARLVKADGASNYWHLNETSGILVRDSIDGADGTISGGVTLGQVGATIDNDRAMLFNGTTGKVFISVNIIVQTNFTLEAWIKTNSTANQRPILSNRAANGLPATAFQLVMDINGFLNIQSDALGGLSGFTLINDNQWHHVVGIVGGGLVWLGVDGVLGPPSGVTFPGSSLPLMIGNDLETNSFWSGLIDEVAIYPVVLTAAQVLAHYQAGKR